MRRDICVMAGAAIFFLPLTVWSQQSGQSQAQNQAEDQPAQTSAPQQDSLAAAARRAREQKKEEPKSPKVFTNDDLPTNAAISIVGESSAPPTGKSTAIAPAKPVGSSAEQMWRDRFAKLNHKLDQDQSELDILQRELGILNTQYYGGDPMKGLQQGMTQTDISDKTAKIDEKKKDVAADQQAISDAEAELRKEGGDPGWER